MQQITKQNFLIAVQSEREKTERGGMGKGGGGYFSELFIELSL